MAELEEVLEFLDRKGAVGVLSATYHRGQFTSLQEWVDVAPKTLKRRLNEAEELGLIAVGQGGYPSAKDYHHTLEGRALWEVMDELGTDGAFGKYHEAKKEYREAAEDFKQYIKENADELEPIETGETEDE